MQDRNSSFKRSAFQAMEIVSVSACGRALEGGEEGLWRKGRWNVFQFVAVGVESEQVRKAAELVFSMKALPSSVSYSIRVKI
jgi:hypothetical protein